MHIEKALFQKTKCLVKAVKVVVWRSKIWASGLGPGTSFHQQHARGEEITEDRCN